MIFKSRTSKDCNIQTNWGNKMQILTLTKPVDSLLQHEETGLQPLAELSEKDIHKVMTTYQTWCAYAPVKLAKSV